MSANVVKLELVEVGEDFRFDPDFILEAAKGRKFQRLVIIGEIEDEEDLYVAGTANAGESLILIEWAKAQVLRR